MSNELHFEKSFWGKCCNTFQEDEKHYTYGHLMELKRKYYSFVLPNKSVMDIGGGPTSMLLKCHGLTRGLVVDPIDYPSWTVERYNSMNIDVRVDFGENVTDTGFDEVWIYNCLQHTEDPEKIIHNARRAAPVLRFFEWIDIPAHEGHPHELKEDILNKWTGGKGGTCFLNENSCYGRCYYGVFS